MGKITRFTLVGLLGIGLLYKTEVAKIIDSATLILKDTLEDFTENAPKSFHVEQVSKTLDNGGSYIDSIVLGQSGNHYANVKITIDVSRQGKPDSKLSYTRNVEIGPYNRQTRILELLPIGILERTDDDRKDEPIIDFSFQTISGRYLPGDFYVRLTPEVLRQYQIQFEARRKWNAVPAKLH